MKNKDRIRMLLHPEQYSEEQLDQMLDETNIPVPDKEEEWQLFKASHQQHKGKNPMMRWAAIIVTMVALSGITYAAIQHFIKTGDVQELPSAPTQSIPSAQEADDQKTYSVAPAVEKNDTIRQDQQFNNVELQLIMQQLSHDFGVKVVFKNEATRKLRFYLKWEANDSIQDILNHINHFEKVHLTLSKGTITIE